MSYKYNYSTDDSNFYSALAEKTIQQAVHNVDRNTLPHITTFTGKKYRHLWPLPEDICIEDIAHSLARLCRFCGHINAALYSVAQHSVLVSYYCQSEFAKWGLLHDAGETYITDLPRPLKRANGLEIYREYEKLTNNAICLKFGLDYKEPDNVKETDTKMLATEMRDLFTDERMLYSLTSAIKPYPDKIQPWTAEESERRFLARYYDLF